MRYKPPVGRGRRLRVLAASAALAALAGCNFYYNDVPSPDALMHAIPWFDHMIQQPSVKPYSRADIPRSTVDGTVPVTGGERDWFAEWSVANTTTADKLVNPGRTASAVGDTLYHTYCATCHGPLGAGDGPVGVKLAARSLLTDIARKYTDGYLYSIIRYGRGVMPRYGDKIPQEGRWAVVEYVRALQRAAPAPVPAVATVPGGKN